MNIPVKTLQNTDAGSMNLPSQFEEPIRLDLISRAVHAYESQQRQAYGAKEGAGQRHSAKLSRRRRNYRGSYGHGISRVPRKIHTRRGTRFHWVGALAPGTVGGRRAHPPKIEKIWEQKINVKEKRKAIRSALAATMNKELVEQRGHILPKLYPIIVEDAMESLTKTKEVKKVLEQLGFKEDFLRTALRKIRAGKGKMRGRRYQTKIGTLLVVGDENSKLLQSANNIRGIDIVPVNALNAKLLAPGTHPGRLTLFTKKAIEKMNKEKMFI